ncbi:MAG: ABC transporter ATP-binding protein [Ruminococcaceae bacterium]|nr:ABC transporter ATP-binding protein [Oscillospiraceae bacterium]
MKKRERPRYGMPGNLWYMTALAWQTRRSLLLFLLITAAAAVGVNALQLYVVPQILRQVEIHAALSALLLVILFFAGGLFSLGMLSTYLENLSVHGRLEIRAALRDRILAKMHRTAYENATDPRILNLRKNALNTTADEASAAEQVYQNGRKVLVSVGTFLFYLTVLSRVSLWLVVLMIGMTLCSTLVAKRCYSWDYFHREEKGAYMNRLEYLRDKSESVSFAKDVRIFGLKPWMDQIYHRTLQAYRKYIVRSEIVHFRGNLADVFIMSARAAISYLYLIYLALTEGMSAADFLLYFSAVAGLSRYINDIFIGITDLYRNTLEIAAVREFLDVPEPYDTKPKRPIPAALRPELRLQDVSYRYPGSERDTISHMNLTIHPGENLAIVGLNGAGKTTLVKLLCGLLDPTEGQVLLDGVDIREYDRTAYYALFSAVFQEHSLLDASIAENIAGDGEIDADRLGDAIEKAGLTAKVNALPDGIQTKIGKEVYADGILLSGGQTQRLLLARALYKNGSFLLLDEPTAALDPLAEDAMYRKYHEMTRGKTSVFISHRLASTRFCDRVLFLVNGDIAEEGTHEALLALDGQYAALFRVQSQYYQEQEGMAYEEA